MLVGTGSGGIRTKGRDDVAVFAGAHPMPTAATFTRNNFAAAPVTIARQHLRGGRSQAWLVNSGNANCGTGKRGLATASSSCAHLGQALGIPATQVIPFSTGVIMEPLSAARLHAGCDVAASRLQPGNWRAAAKAIMTTDTVAKGASVQLRAKGGKVTLTGIAKGSGMIHPNMATMLAFLATDADVPLSWLRTQLRTSVAASFNRISVDGDTSTNDATILAATGMAGKQSATELKRLAQALEEMCRELAQAVVRDGEGATTTATVTVTGLASDQACRAVADAIACSPLIKTMLHARDANLGRLLMAIGKAPVACQPEAVTIKIHGLTAFSNGQRAARFTENVASRLMRKDPVTIAINAGPAKTEASCMFCDLGPGYIKINAEYRS